MGIQTSSGATVLAWLIALRQQLQLLLPEETILLLASASP
jgi:hypothetical protein